MTIRDLALQARSYRRFQESADVAMSVLVNAVDAARNAPSGANQQPLRYALSTSRDTNAAIFPHLGWAAQLKEWKGPAEGERPAAYVVVGGDLAIPKNHQVDLGIAAQTINLALAEAGLSACMLANINAKAIHDIVAFPDSVAVLLVIAIGRKGETVILNEVGSDGATNYWRDAEDRHHVPKRGLDDVVLKRFE